MRDMGFFVVADSRIFLQTRYHHKNLKIFGVWRMIREFARKLAAFTEFVDYIAVETEFRRGKFDSSAEILKKHSVMALVRVCSSEAELLVKLIRPRREITATIGSRIQSTGKIWRVFTKSEILEFVTAVDDKNKIYQLNPPIVPNLLILETLFEEFAMNFIKVKFKTFITAGEPLFLNVYENKFEIKSASVRKISGKFS